MTGVQTCALPISRGYNATHADRVRFVGVEFYATGRPTYDRVKAYVAQHAPGRLREVRRHFRVIRPRTDDIFAYIQGLEGKDLRPQVRHARELLELVAGLPHRSVHEHALATRTAHQILSFYEHYDRPAEARPDYRDAHAADNLRWWRARTGDRIAYWAASPHTSNAAHLRITMGADPDLRFASAGSHLRRWYGRHYLSIGFTVDRGVVSTGYGGLVPLEPARPEWFEHRLTAIDEDQLVLDLRAPAPAPVRAWLRAPALTRGLPNGGPDSYTSGGTLAEWFDVVVHRQVTTPTSAISP